MSPEMRNGEIAEIISRKGLRALHRGMLNVDCYEVYASEVVLWGSSGEARRKVGSILFGYGDDYITLRFDDGSYEDVSGCCLRDILT